MAQEKDVEVVSMYRSHKLDASCWFIFEAESNNPPKVSFYNPRQSNDYENFSEFSQSFLENFNGVGLVEQTTHREEKRLLFAASEAVAFDEFVGSAGHSERTFYGKAAIFEVYDGFDLSKIQSHVKAMKRGIESMEGAAADGASLSDSYAKAPYSYYGVHPKNF